MLHSNYWKVIYELGVTGHFFFKIPLKKSMKFTHSIVYFIAEKSLKRTITQMLSNKIN